MKNLFIGVGLIVIVCLQCACKKKDSGTSTTAPVITGIAEKDYNADPLDTVGIANVSTIITGARIDCYPNPCSQVFHMAFTLTQAASVRVWMVAASYPDAPTGVSVQNQSLLGQSKPLIDTTAALVAGNQNNLSLNISSLPAGYYRVYATVGQNTLWDNIWIAK